MVTLEYFLITVMVRPSYHYDFNLKNKSISFYKNDYTQRSPQNLFTQNDFLNTSNHLKFTLLFEEAIDADGSIVTLYIDNQLAHTVE